VARLGKTMKCTYDPKILKGKPIGMFHCPECGEMVVAGMDHPDYDDPALDCQLCWELREKLDDNSVSCSEHA